MKDNLLCLRRKRILLIFLTLFYLIPIYADQGYAVFDSTTGTLTFKYGIPSGTQGVDYYDTDATGASRPGWDSVRSQITNVVFESSFSQARPTSCYFWFYLFKKLVTISGIENLNTSEVTNMNSMFSSCIKLTSLDVSHFNTSNVTDMKRMFAGCSALTSLDVSGFNTDNVTDMGGMFQACSAITNLDVSKFNTTSVSSMEQMFHNNSSLTTIYCNNDWNTSNVTSSAIMFAGCTNLSSASSGVSFDAGNANDVTFANPTTGYFTSRQGYAVFDSTTGTLTFKYGSPTGTLNVDYYDTDATGTNFPGWNSVMSQITNVVFESSFSQARPTSCYYWFSNGSNITSISGIENLNTSEVTNMKSMFRMCDKLTSLDVSNFNTAKVTSMSSMFLGCSSLTNLDVCGFNTENVTSMEQMFQDCSSLTSLDVNNFDISNVSVMIYMFRNCNSLATIYCNNDWNTTKNPYSLHMFTDCTNLRSASSGISYSASNANDVTSANPTTGYFTSRSPQGYAVFDSTTGTLTFKYGIPSGTQGVDYYDTDATGTNYPGWNSIMSQITNVVFESSFSQARPISCCRWFHGGSNITSISGIENLNTSEVTDMNSMFNGCSSLTSLDLSTFDTSNVTIIGSMFTNCRSLTSLDLSHFDTSKLTGSLYGMFYNCSSLNRLDLGKFNISNVTGIQYMFYGCSSLTSLDLSSFDTSNVTYMQSMFSGCSSLTSLDLSSFDTSNVTYMSEMFRGCSNLTTIYCNNDWNTSNVTSSAYMFTDCTNLSSASSGVSYNASNANDKTFANPTTGYFTSRQGYAVFDSTTGTLTFKYGTPTGTLNVDYYDTDATGTSYPGPGWSSVISQITNVVFESSFSQARPTSCYFWFLRGSNITSISGIENLNTSEVTNMNSMFMMCDKLTSLDVSNFNTAKVTDISYMFQSCSAITNLDVSNFNTANVTNLQNMFCGCQNLNSLNVSGFNTGNVTIMNHMFSGCSSLPYLDVSGFNTMKVTNMQGMFNSCRSLTSLTFGENFTFANCTGNSCLSGVFTGCSKMRYMDFYASSDDISNGFSNTNINRTANSYNALFGSTSNGLPMTTVIYMPHGIRRSDYPTSSNYSGLPNLVFNEPENGGLIANTYSSVDKVDIEFPRAFHANMATYSRTMNAATQYGTAILPYAFKTNNDVQAYTLNQELTEQMYFVEAETVPAHTPFFYKKKNPTATSVSFMITDENPSDSNYEIAVEATHTTSAAEDGEPYETGSGMDGWETRGYYVLETITANNNGTFYISGDKFLKAMGTVKMNPHRVTFHGEWLKGEPSTSEGASYMDFVMMEAPAETEEPTETQDPVVDENLPEEVITALEAADLRKEASEAIAIYDAQGRTRQTLQKGLNLIRKQDGSVTKVFIR